MPSKFPKEGPDDKGDPGNAGRPRYPGTFLQAVREQVAALGWNVTDWQGDGFEFLTADGEKRFVGLDNLYKRCRQADRAEWPAMIRDFFETVHSPEHQELTDDAPLSKFADRLMPRIGKKFADLGDVRPWSNELDDTGLFVNLVIDFPKTVAFVNEDRMADSGRPWTEWLEKALDNLHARSPLDCLEIVDDDTDLMMCQTNDSFDAARALILNRLTVEPPGGFLVAIPKRDLLLVQPVVKKAIPYLHLIKFSAEKFYKGAPYSISDEVYWVRRCTWQPFSIEVHDKQVTVTPPEEFIEVLSELTDDDDEPPA